MNKVWAYCNFSDDKECDRSLSLLYKLQDIMKSNKFILEVILLESNLCKHDLPMQYLQSLNVSKIYYATNNFFDGINNYSAYVEGMQILIAKYNPKYLMFSGSRHNRAVAAQLATALECGLTAECSQYYINTDDEIVQIRPTFEGNKYAHIISKSSVKMSTALPAPYQQISTLSSLEKLPDIETIELSLATLNKDTYISTSSLLNIFNFRKLDQYDVIFVAGMGLGSEKNVNKLKNLAQKYNVGFGASRPVVEMGWAKQSNLIGMSGNCISPDLYVAFGVSGSLQHMEGMRNSKRIISINTDKKAPLHQLCYAVVYADAVYMLDYLLNT